MYSRIENPQVTRLTGELVGNAEYYVTHNGIKFRFPSGIIHYYGAYDVRPSVEFYRMVMELDPETVGPSHKTMADDQNPETVETI